MERARMTVVLRERKGEMETLRAELVKAAKQEEDVEMGGTGSPSQKIMLSAVTTNTEMRTYAQAAAQAQADVTREKAGGQGKGPRITTVTSEVSEMVPEVSEVSTSLSHRFPFTEDLREYQKEERKSDREGTMAKAVVVNGMPINWRINGEADCAGRIMGEVIGVRWILNEGRRIAKAASSVVVYLQNKVFLGPEACIKMSGKWHSVVAYRWRARFQFRGWGAFVGEVLLEVHLRLCCYYTGGWGASLAVLFLCRYTGGSGEVSVSVSTWFHRRLGKSTGVLFC